MTFDSKPLSGKRILVTRPKDQAVELVDRLFALGGHPIEAPTIKIAPVENYDLVDEACELISTFDWVIFTSANGVDYFMNRLRLGLRDARELKGVRICAVGPSTEKRLERYGVNVDMVPTEYRAEAVVEALRARETIDQQRVLLPRGDLARDTLPELLDESGAEVVTTTVYRTVLPITNTNNDPNEYANNYKMLLAQELDVVTFTSASSAQNFVKILGTETVANLLNTAVVAAIGPVTADAAVRLGMHVEIMPTSYTVPALVEAIVDYFVRKTSLTG